LRRATNRRSRASSLRARHPRPQRGHRRASSPGHVLREEGRAAAATATDARRHEARLQGSVREASRFRRDQLTCSNDDSTTTSTGHSSSPSWRCAAWAS
jgi:hypothetical protein